MLQAVLKEASVMKKVIEAIKDLVTDGNIDCSPQGMSMQAMDSVNVALVDLRLANDGFDVYKCKRPMTIGVNLLSMAKIMKLAGNTDKMVLSAMEVGDTLNFHFHSQDRKKQAKFELKLMDIDVDMMEMPTMEYEAVVEMPSAGLQRIVRDLMTLGDQVLIGVDEDGVEFNVIGDEGKGSIKVMEDIDEDKEDHLKTKVELTRPVKLLFALRYLNFFTRATPLADTVKLSMSTDVPLCIEYAFGELGYLRFHLAPKINEAEN